MQREEIDNLRGKDFLALCRGPDGAIVCDEEGVLFNLAICLGFVAPGCDNWKDVLYVNNPITHVLCEIRELLTNCNVLKYDAEKDWYLIPDLKTARVVCVQHNGESEIRSKQLRQLLLWGDDLCDGEYKEENGNLTFSYVTEPLWKEYNT